jgi:hypothetical protein
MATIWGTDKILLYGGTNNTILFDDTWVYDLSDNKWILKKPFNKPFQKAEHAMAPIWGTDKVLLFGGGDETNDTWIYDLSENNWTKKTPTKSPWGRFAHAMATIWGTDKVVLFGGIVVGCYSHRLNDTWVYDLSENNWIEKKPNIIPTERGYHAMTTIHGMDKILMIGGSWDVIDDYCIYDSNEDNWIIIIKESPYLIHSHGIANIYGTDKVLLFGGGGDYYNQTWLYDLNQDKWVIKNTKIQPKGRVSYAMASVYGTNDVIIFGGEIYKDGNITYFNDTWICNLTTNGTGNYISEPFDIGLEAYFKTLSWNASIFNGTSIKFQLRSGLDESDLYLKPFIGPDSSTSTFYTTSSSNIWFGHNSDRWIQYKVYIESTEVDLSPILFNVSISYNCIPSLDNPIVTPETGDVTKQFNFTIEYLDRDNDPPKYVRVNIDGINYKMKESNGNDMLFLDGKSYWYSTKFNRGYHSYQFFTSDGEAKRATEMKCLNISFGPIDHIIIEPASATITTDEYQIFNAKCFDVENNLLQITPTWAATGGGIIDLTGNFTANKPGIWTIFANNSGISGNAIIQVIPGKLNQIIITPQSPTITTDDFQLFAATGYDLDKNVLPISPTWAISGGGIIDQIGNFTAITPGGLTVYANQSGISGNTTINVTPGKLNQIIITPQYIIITTDEIQLFNATGYDEDMNVISISPIWEVSGGGAIDQSGNFIATIPGIWVVYANQSGISGNTIISVTSGTPHLIIISPKYAELNESESLVFISKVFDADKNELDIIPSWEVTGGGTIDNNGRFTATKVGIWIIYANLSGISANATIKVLFVENYENIPSEEEENDKGKTFAVGFEVVMFIVIIILIFTFFILFKKKLKIETHKEKIKVTEVEKPPQPQSSVAKPVPMIRQSTLHTSTTTPVPIHTPKPLSLPGIIPAVRTTQPSMQPQVTAPPMAKPIQSKLTSTISHPLLPPASETNTYSNSSQQE